MRIHFEVIYKHQPTADADHLLYTPIKANLTERHSRVYDAEVEGDVTLARSYMLSVLVDSIAQDYAEAETPLLSDALFVLDYGMKAGALDLEKEAILTNYCGVTNRGFELRSLKITQRVYVFGVGDKEALSQRFAKDVCNPAIHNWQIS